MLCWEFERQQPQDIVEVRADANHSACPVTRRSTTGYTAHLGRHTLVTGSSTQNIVSLSTGESEFYGAVKGATRLLGLHALLTDMGCHFKMRLGTDSSAAKGIASRRGAGSIRHIHGPSLWLQQTVARRQLALFKVAGDCNTADLGTKVLNSDRIKQLLGQLGIRKVKPSTLQLTAQQG